MMSDKSLVVRCDCFSAEHIAILDYIKIGCEDKQLFLSIHLESLPMLKRLVYAFRYIFGYKSSTGAFSEIVINEDQLKDIVDFLVEVQND